MSRATGEQKGEFLPCEAIRIQVPKHYAERAFIALQTELGIQNGIRSMMDGEYVVFAIPCGLKTAELAMNAILGAVGINNFAPL